MEVLKPIWSFTIGNFKLDIVPEIVIQWVIMLLIIALVLFLTSNFKLRPSKKQAAVESLYTTIKNLVTDNMDETYLSYVPYIGTLAVFLIFMNLTALVGVPSPTKNLSVTVGLALITFFMVQYTSIKRFGLKGYFVGYLQPMAPMLPLNIMERFVLLLSLSLRLFGNIMAGTFIIDLCYSALGSVSPILQLGIPIPLHAFFDLFDGSIQTFVFIMLTMINIKLTAEHSDLSAHH